MNYFSYLAPTGFRKIDPIICTFVAEKIFRMKDLDDQCMKGLCQIGEMTNVSSHHYFIKYNKIEIK